MFYPNLHCPYCGSAKVEQKTEAYNWKVGVLAMCVINIFGLLVGYLVPKNTQCRCHNCGKRFLLQNNNEWL